jgi:proteasome accessory factor C
MQAVNVSQDVEITYHSLYSDEISERTITPQAIYEEDGNSYLRAFCRSAKALRVFRIDRIVSLSESDGQPDGIEDSKDLVKADGFESEKIAYTIKIKRLTRDVIERFNLGQILQDNSKTKETTVELSSFSREWIQRAVLATGSDIELLSPPELREEVAGRARLLMDRYAQK